MLAAVLLWLLLVWCDHRQCPSGQCVPVPLLTPDWRLCTVQSLHTICNCSHDNHLLHLRLIHQRFWLVPKNSHWKINVYVYYSFENTSFSMLFLCHFCHKKRQWPPHCPQHWRRKSDNVLKFRPSALSASIQSPPSSPFMLSLHPSSYPTARPSPPPPFVPLSVQTFTVMFLKYRWHCLPRNVKQMCEIRCKESFWSLIVWLKSLFTHRKSVTI